MADPIHPIEHRDEAIALLFELGMTSMRLERGGHGREHRLEAGRALHHIGNRDAEGFGREDDLGTELHEL